MSFALVPLSVRDARAWLARSPRPGHRYHVRRPSDQEATLALAVFAVADNQPLARHRVPASMSQQKVFEASPSAVAIVAALPGAPDTVTMELADTYVASHHSALVLYGAVRRAVHALGYQRLVSRIGHYSALRAARWQWQRIQLGTDQSTYAYVAPGDAPSPTVAAVAGHYSWPRWWRSGRAGLRYPLALANPPADAPPVATSLQSLHTSSHAPSGRNDAAA
jgi:hypothetical protein